MNRCKGCGKPIPDWAEYCPECASLPERVAEVVAVVFYYEDGDWLAKEFTDDVPFEEVRKFFETVGRARLVVKDGDSWKRIDEKF